MTKQGKIRGEVKEVARSCSICSHPRVSEIDSALLGKTAYRTVAKYFDASESSVYRHAREHLPVGPTRRAPAPAHAPVDGVAQAGSAETSHPNKPSASATHGQGRVDLLGYMVRIQKRTLGILESARTAGRHETALKAVRESRGNIEVIARLLQDGGDALDLRKLNAVELSLLLRASLGELSVRERQTVLLEAPELVDFALDQS